MKNESGKAERNPFAAYGFHILLAQALRNYPSGFVTNIEEKAYVIYGFKTLVDPDTGRILGAHLVGPHVDEVINLFGLAIRRELTADDLKSTMFAYPTGASDIGDMV